MGIEYSSQTGNPIVDAMSTIRITGNVIPEAWYTTIVSPTTGKADTLSILFLRSSDRDAPAVFKCEFFFG